MKFTKFYTRAFSMSLRKSRTSSRRSKEDKKVELDLRMPSIKCFPSDAAVPPWVGYNEEEQMKVQILEVSKVRVHVLLAGLIITV